MKKQIKDESLKTDKKTEFVKVGKPKKLGLRPVEA